MLRRLTTFFLVMVFICSGLLAGCNSLSTSTPGPNPTPAATPGPVVSKPSDPSPPITVKMTLSKAPRLNETADIVMVVNTIADTPDTTVSYEFPDSVVFESGSLNWKGDLKQKEPLTLKATIKITREGQLTLMGKASSKQSNGDVWADAAYIYLTVHKDAGFAGWATQENPNQGKQPLPTPPSTNP